MPVKLTSGRKWLYKESVSKLQATFKNLKLRPN
jgi:hypothetical protein